MLPGQPSFAAPDRLVESGDHAGARRRDNPDRQRQTFSRSASRWLCTALSLPLLASISGCATSQTASPEPPAPAVSSTTASNADGSQSASEDVDVTSLRALGSAGRQQNRAKLSELSQLEQARLMASCAPLSWGGYYCLGLGFSDERPDFTALLASGSGAATGDLRFSEWVSQRVAMPLRTRLAQQSAEVSAAVLGLDKARALAATSADLTPNKEPSHEAKQETEARVAPDLERLADGFVAYALASRTRCRIGSRCR